MIVVVGVVLRAWHINIPLLWYDEINTRIFAALPIDKLLAATAGDVHPPLYYLLVKLALGEARLVSLIAACCALAVMLPLAEELGLSCRQIVVAVALMAVSPFQIWAAQEGRMYSLLTMEVMLAAWLALRRSRWLALALAALLWTHNYGWIYCAVIGALAIWSWMHIRTSEVWWCRLLEALWRTVPLGALALLCYVPWAMVLLRQVAAVKTDWWQQPTAPGGALYAFYALFWQYAVPDPMAPVAALVVFVILAYAVGLAIHEATTGEDDRPAILVLLTILPALLALNIEVVYRPIFLVRALAGSAPFMILLMAWAISRPGNPWRERLALGALAPICLAAVLWGYPQMARNKGVAMPIVHDIAIAYREGDFIMHMNSGTLLGFHEQYPDPEAWQALYWPPAPGSLGVLSEATLRAMGVTLARPEQLPWNRLWLVWGAGPTIGAAEDLAVEQLLKDYPSTAIWLMSEHYQVRTATGGVWLLERSHSTSR